MPFDLPRTYKAAVFTEANKPLTIEERELKLPEDGQVSQATELSGHSPNANSRFSSKFWLVVFATPTLSSDLEALEMASPLSPATK